jgi:general secretion pathway protein A
MYEEFFGLSDLPFRLTPDPRYLFLSPKHAEALAHLRLGLTESSGFVCITGDIGTGKTTLLRTFLAELGPEVSAAYVFNPALSARELLQRVNNELGVPTTGSEMELVDALNAHLLAQRRAGRLSVVVVDEAQALSVGLLEQLRLLSNLETTTEKLLRLVLVGQPQLRTLLVDPELAQLNQRITLRWHIGPLTLEETVEYIHHRLSVASDGRATHLFTRSAIALVHRYAKGVPRLVNMIAHRSLLAAFVARRREVTAAIVRRAYREIEAVPLRKTLPSRRIGWAAAATLFGIGIAMGVPRLDLRWDAVPMPSLAPAAVETTAPAAPVAPEPPEKVAAAPAPPPAPVATRISGWDLERRLASADSVASARAATDAVLAAWQVAPLATEELADTDDLTRIAWRRGLEMLPLTGNLSMLRLLDLPAVLELRIPGANGVRYAALVGVDDRGPTLMLDGQRVALEPMALDKIWLGQAHVIWRDFESLGTTLGARDRGRGVVRLKELLVRAGIHAGGPLGAPGEDFDPDTERAVVEFQRSRLLVPDGRVGRLTRIVLYGAAGGYPRPTLAREGGATS